MVFANSSDGFLFGPGLLATHDGGRSWVRQLLPPVLTIQTGDGYAYALTQRAGRASRAMAIRGGREPLAAAAVACGRAGYPASTRG